MNSAPNVSVIIPAFNCESYIAQTISSVLSQSYQDFELIVVDDGSTDKTQEIVASFEPRVRLIKQNNSGVCKARNTGLMAARGKFVCFLDHDDFWFSDKLSQQVFAFQENPEVGVVYSHFFLWYSDNSSHNYPEPTSYDLTVYQDGIEPDFSGWIYHKLLLDCWVLTSTAMIRSEVLQKCGGFDESLPYSEDWDLWLRISREYKFAKLLRPNTLYRQHPSQGNRMLRTIDYRAELLIGAAKKWGLCSPDGKCVTRQEFNRNLAWYHVEYAIGHIRAGNKAIAIRSLLKGFATDPRRLKYLLYIAAALIGWKPKY